MGSLPDVGAAGWRPIVRVRDLEVFERDEPRGPCRPLRLGLTEQEGWELLVRARRSAEAFLTKQVAGAPGAAGPAAVGGSPRLAQPTAVAVALWTRGRLRGSITLPPGPGLRGMGRAAVAACKDVRFGPLTAVELAHTRFQVGLVHSPGIPLSHAELRSADAYPDKAVFLSEGARAGVYLPEIFNVRRLRTQLALTTSLAREKLGLEALSRETSAELHEVSELIESADRSHAVRLDGPVACADVADWRAAARAAGKLACDWLAALQREDGSLPQRVRVIAGASEGLDAVRMAVTAHGLAAFGAAMGLETAVQTSRRVTGWLERSRVAWSAEPAQALLTGCALGKAALALGDEAAADRAVTEVLGRVDRAPESPLVRANVASLLWAAAPGRADAARCCDSLGRELRARFLRATEARSPLSLAEWAELAAAFPPGSTESLDVARWLASMQLPSGAFPSTTASAFAYTRGTGKVFEVLALRPNASTLEPVLRWLLAMQYRPDSTFFVPEEHQALALGGFRHDAFDTDAWIDAAGHVLLGLARLERA